MLGLTACGKLIVDRLKLSCRSALGNVFSTGELSGVEEKRQVSPALHVVLHSYAPADEIGGDTVWHEVWLVVAVVKNVTKDRAAGQIEDAGALLHEVLAALSGWRPQSGGAALKSIAPPRPTFSESHAYFPLAFLAQPITAGAEDCS